ncbi:methionyl-tRNA synthetase [Breznakia sp. PF5-3]|uniref:methionine--tRNA ligase n=1 Tax=unclassified Breznakia TaxID=2623764 RepID=UPI0024061B7A|nr:MULTISPECIES: methionine--tRNA ligase [unclassified Breznakia]MDF9824813.1 methionyl-tRNA synthetase [Breznakia sp. PM6-1]MDF9835225.1 methionyl-tRNA synthetase [Breznakia sp. PF5-3]MDF9837337.1 methionyl-tRNA synthetase [Breznakia sp. PFB2-8]MDF9859739.1 methionyl-tRNA synthetase [Breznakia sp. PH5-24]
MGKEKYYITTAIAYTSGKPHIGNVYEIILADSIARYKRMVGYDVLFQTGTDEHGQKIEDKAKEKNITPQEYVDEVAGTVRSMFDLANTSYDRFIRTTDSDHKAVVQKIFRKLYEQGDIYKGEYEGWYCKACESFFTESQLNDGKCPDCGGEVYIAKEETYFFKMSKYQDRLMKHIEDNPEFIQPESRKNEMINNFLKPGLQDLAVSRTSFKWGIPVDFDEKHVIYVWIDALSNYITGIGYDPDGNHGELYKKYWPADLHLIGKDILRFHTIYWPIMLMALDVPLPKQIFGHPWILVGEGKMSKSKGNVIYTDDLVRYFGVDAVRYYVLHEMPYAQDGVITWDLMIERNNSDLANVLGNLVNRTISMANKYFDGVVRNPKISDSMDEELITLAQNTVVKVDEHMDSLHISDAISDIFTLIRRSNKYIDETCPWILAKDEAKQDRLQTVLYNLLESIRYTAVLLSPFVPETSDKILKQLNTNKKDYASIQQFGQLEEDIKLVEKPEILFQRVDEKEFAEQWEAEQNSKKEEVTPAKPEITFDDFMKTEMKVGLIEKCEKHPKADKLLVSQINIGSEVRQVVSGIADAYKPEDMVGKKVVVVTNLKPAKIRGVESQGMILVGENGDQIEVLNVNHLDAGSIVR